MNFNVAFTKSGNGLTQTSQPGMMSLIRSSEYSDVESSDDDNDVVADNHDDGEHEDATTEVQHTYERYGIGAKLLIKMGYEQGKALGSGDKGLVNPLDVKLRPKGLGVGGINEKTEQAEQMTKSLHSPDETTEADGKFLRDYIQLIDQLEDLGVSVPTTFKQAAESRDKTVLETHNSRLRRITLELLALSNEEAELQSTLARLPLVYGLIDDEISSTINDEAVLLNVQRGVLSLRDSLSEVLSELVFLTLIDSIKNKTSLEELKLFRQEFDEKFGMSDQYDQIINEIARERCKVALYSGDFDAVKDIAELQPQVEQEVVIPHIQSQLNHWNPFRERLPSRIIEYFKEFRFGLSALSKLIAPVETKVWEFVHNLTHEVQKASKDDLKHYRVQLGDICDTWSRFIAKARGDDSWYRIEAEMWRVFLEIGRLVAERPIDATTKWALDVTFDISDETVRELIFLMGFGNAWVRQCRRKAGEANWLPNWMEFLWDNGFGDEDVIRWYVNKACYCRDHPSDPIELPKLKWKQNPEPPSNPSVETVIEYLKSINASCIA